ncbi:glycosyltransferase [Dietzia maris]|uniref:glycosyltransferase family 4 protein n=1 Tax=Dietzia maris TaxID=37915 RepID=UPI0036F336D6
MGVRPDSSADWPPSRIGFFGRLKKYKGVDVAIEAVAAVREKFPELTLDIIGEGDRHLVSESKHFGAPWLKLQLGWVDDSLIPDVLSELDLLVLPYQEATQSGVIAVAAALRLPVVVTPVGALPDQIDALGCGIVAPNCGVEDISYAVMRMIESRDLFQSCQGSQALESWGWSSGVDKILSSIANRCELAG